MSFALHFFFRNVIQLTLYNNNATLLKELSVLHLLQYTDGYCRLVNYC